MKLIISENELFEMLVDEINRTEYLLEIPKIEEYMIRQASKESNNFILATRFEPHLMDASLGLYQVLIKTLEWIGYNEGIEKYLCDPKLQVRSAVQYMDFLYSRFPEIHNELERIKMAFSSYNSGRGNVNRALARGMQEEGIKYIGSNTKQGKWATYENVNKMFRKYNIIADRNADINQRYVNYIVEKE